MPVATIPYTTGPSVLKDVGLLFYNDVVFSPMFVTKISGKIVQDDANRTTKFIEYVIQVDGYVTIEDNQASVNNIMELLRTLLTQPGGRLIYEGRGFDIDVNRLRGTSHSVNFSEDAQKADVAWGPFPELIDFQPLGGGKSAQVVWKVTVRIPELKRGGNSNFLQFNYETQLEYGEDYFSTLHVNGVLEIPMTRNIQTTRTLTETVDNYRDKVEARVFAGVDLSRFTIANRSFNISRDKRILQFSVTLREKPYMDLPPGCPNARGSYSVKPSKQGPGLASWTCTLRGTYTVAPNWPRRTAWVHFLSLLRLRMRSSEYGPDDVIGGDARPFPARALSRMGGIAMDFVIGSAYSLGPVYAGMRAFARSTSSEVDRVTPDKDRRRAFLIDFSIDEGIYSDSKTVTFSASWRMVSTFQYILRRSGLWRKVPEKNVAGENLWAQSMATISQSQSWIRNELDPNLDIIVDFGGG